MLRWRLWLRGILQESERSAKCAAARYDSHVARAYEETKGAVKNARFSATLKRMQGRVDGLSVRV